MTMDRDKLMASAHQKVRVAIRAGKLPSPSVFACQDCGCAATMYDHRDYEKPLVVAPVCSGCNVRRSPAHPLPLARGTGVLREALSSMMTFNQLKDALQSVNLSKLGRLSGLSVRTLRRIRNGTVGVALSTTIEKAQPHLRSARRK